MRAMASVSVATACLVEGSPAADVAVVPEGLNKTLGVEHPTGVTECVVTIDEAGQPIAFVQVSGETFEKRHLKLGIRDAGRVEVLSGLSAGDRVVTRGGYAIRLAAASSILPDHGHAH